MAQAQKTRLGTIEVIGTQVSPEFNSLAILMFGTALGMVYVLKKIGYRS